MLGKGDLLTSCFPIVFFKFPLLTSLLSFQSFTEVLRATFYDVTCQKKSDPDDEAACVYTKGTTGDAIPNREGLV